MSHPQGDDQPIGYAGVPTWVKIFCVFALLWVIFYLVLDLNHTHGIP